MGNEVQGQIMCGWMVIMQSLFSVFPISLSLEPGMKNKFEEIWFKLKYL